MNDKMPIKRDATAIKRRQVLILETIHRYATDHACANNIIGVLHTDRPPSPQAAVLQGWRLLAPPMNVRGGQGHVGIWEWWFEREEPES